MLNKVRYFILFIKWKLTLYKIKKEQLMLFDSCVLFKEFFKKKTFNVEPRVLYHYQIEAASYSLHTMLAELERILEEWKRPGGRITQDKDIGKPSIYRLDQWSDIKPDSKFYGMDLFDGWVRATELINRLYELTPKDDKGYVQRRSFKPLNTYMALTKLLLEVSYG